MFNIVSIVSFCFGADVLSLNASLLKKYYYDSLYNMELGEAAIFVSRYCWAKYSFAGILLWCTVCLLVATAIILSLVDLFQCQCCLPLDARCLDGCVKLVKKFRFWYCSIFCCYLTNNI